uniref:Lipid-binding serum glycoprotein N-terminal domain-containing protein n=1 Tax=Sparus aurata TaxID=8175 RepID=A0A671XR56_SPAAU
WDSAILDMWVLSLELLLATLHGEVLSLIQTVLEVLDCDLQVLLHPLQVRTGVSLHLLLDSQGIIPAPDLRIKSALHGVNHPLAVPLDLLHLLILLCQLPVNLTFDLVELKLDTENFGLLMLQCALKKSQTQQKVCIDFAGINSK